MAEHARANQNKHEDVDQKHRVNQKESQPSFEQVHAWEQGTFPVTETPFQPRMDEHAELLAAAHSDNVRANLALHLQQTYGNRYMQRLVESVGAQAKLTVNPPNDVYEQEADRVATMVTQKISTSEIQRQAPEEEVEFTTKLSSKIQRQVPDEEEVQMKPGESELATASQEVETSIDNARGGGQTLVCTVREPMERAFGADFSGVRVHTGSEADLLNQKLSARAFTTGQDIFFREGEYSPGSSTGRKLLAHELTHVVQQTQGRINPKRQVKGAEINDDKRLEREADEIGVRARNGTSHSKRAKTVSKAQTYGKLTALPKGPAGQNISSVVQRLVRVDDLKVKHVGHTTDRHHFDIRADIKKGSDDHWDFRQDVRGFAFVNRVQTPFDSSGSGLAITKDKWVDDGYTRKNDTNSNPLIFETTDCPGLPKDIDENDKVTYCLEFRAKIIDTDNNNQVLKQKSGYRIKIEGKDPRRLTQKGFDE